MIAKLTGKIDSIDNDGFIIDVGGVGYWVKASQKVLQSLPETGAHTAIWIEQVIRQEETHLCGFLHKADKLCFRQLLTVQGVGVRVALAILSILSAEELLVAISAQDKTMLTRADGVGPKLASRIVLELKGKLSAPQMNAALPLGNKVMESSPAQDALLGLVNLGYSQSQAHLAVNKAVAEGGGQLTSSDILRSALKSLAKI